MNKRIEYAEFDDLRKIKVGEEETEIKGVKNYQLKSLYAPVLDRKYIDISNRRLSKVNSTLNQFVNVGTDVEGSGE